MENKKYKVMDEYLENWTRDHMCIVDMAEIERLAGEWETTVEALMEQVEEIYCKPYVVIEDNGGGLTLVVFDDEGNVEYLHTGYEYTPGQLREDLENLRNGDNPAEDWEGNEEKPKEIYKQITRYPAGREVVADNDGIYPERMGKAASLEFGIEQ